MILFLQGIIRAVCSIIDSFPFDKDLKNEAQIQPTDTEPEISPTQAIDMIEEETEDLENIIPAEQLLNKSQNISQDVSNMLRKRVLPSLQGLLVSSHSKTMKHLQALCCAIL